MIEKAVNTLDNPSYLYKDERYRETGWMAMPTTHLEAIVGWFDRQYDCPYYCKEGTKTKPVPGLLGCAHCDDEHPDTRACWRKWLVVSPDWWWDA